AVVPVDGDGVSVQRTRIGERAVNCDRIPFVDRAGRRGKRSNGRGDVVDRHVRGSGDRAEVVVGDRNLNRHHVAGGRGRRVVEVLVRRGGEGQHAGRQVDDGVGRAVPP